MNVKVKDLKASFLGVESESQLSSDFFESAMIDVLSKAYRKHMTTKDAYGKEIKDLKDKDGKDLEELLVRVEIKDGHIHIYPERRVVEEVQDDAVEIELADAREQSPDVQIGDMVLDPEFNFSEFTRNEIKDIKSNFTQKIREEEKRLIYEEYHDKVKEMVLGTVETVRDKFVYINIGRTLALMKGSEQIPAEHYYEGQRLLVVITEVNEKTKKNQIPVLVSRADEELVRRLFEREVPEFYQGIIDIKAIARDAGERCKIAVYSKNENIDPIGAFIGPRGTRVQAVINELHGEKIDIFEWSANPAELIQNALSPSETVAVFPNPEVKDGLIVVVPDNQLSLAIGKKGINSRLAHKLSNRKIDIKSVSEIEDAGIDYVAASEAMEREYEEKKAAEHAKEQQQKRERLKTEGAEIVNVDVADFTYNDEYEDVEEEVTNVAQPEETADTTVQSDVLSVKEEDEMEEAARLAKERRKSSRATEVREYTSKFEDLADASHKTEQEGTKVKKKKEEPKKEETEIEKKSSFDQMKPIYSDEELAEIEAAEEEEEDSRWDDDTDYEEYDKYYDED